MSIAYPMRTKPVFKDYIWGGDKLVTKYNKQTDMRPVAESWEVSAYPKSSSIIGNGKFAGKTLRDVIKAHPELICGQKKKFGLFGENKEFPVLIKLLDARDKLSLQVHPNDDYARKNENGSGKNELWYVIDCEENAEVILGFKEELSRGELEAAIKDNSILDKVNRVPVKAGDCFSIPAGMLHAIGGGIVIAEIQQSSDLSYRIYDYNRVGADGKARELHIEKALDVTDTSLKSVNTRDNKAAKLNGFTSTMLTDWKYFAVNLLKIDNHADLNQDAASFTCALLIDGELELEAGGTSIELKAGESVFIPSNLGQFTLKGNATALLTMVSAANCR